MKLEEAIKISEHHDDTFQTYTVTIRHRAVKLLIEAGKEVERLRRIERFDPTIMLPGETKD